MNHKTTLGSAPPGLFWFNGILGFKSVYYTESVSDSDVWQTDAYCVESGEYFWGGTHDAIKREKLVVIAISYDDARADLGESE